MGDELPGTTSGDGHAPEPSLGIVARHEYDIKASAIGRDRETSEMAKRGGRQDFTFVIGINVANPHALVDVVEIRHQAAISRDARPARGCSRKCDLVDFWSRFGAGPGTRIRVRDRRTVKKVPANHRVDVSGKESNRRPVAIPRCRPQADSDDGYGNDGAPEHGTTSR